MIKKRIKGVIFLAIFLAISIMVLNLDVSIRQGINGQYRQIHMPLYVKWTQFVARHYEYRRIAREITRGLRTDSEKTLAILRWTNKDLKQVPQGMSVVDDHVLNIIIRGYGTVDQFQDVFTTLCAYSGMPSFWQKIYSSDRKVWYPLAFVKIGNDWRVFDAYHGLYIKDRKGSIASVNEIINDMSLIDNQDMNTIEYRGYPYKEFYRNLKQVDGSSVLRPDKQMPVRRIFFEVGRIFGQHKTE